MPVGTAKFYGITEMIKKLDDGKVEELPKKEVAVPKSVILGLNLFSR